MNYPAFFSYIFTSSLTPGPNNIMSMSNAGKYGLKKSIPFGIGVLIGVFLVMSCCAVFSSLLYEFLPSVEPFIRCAGALYILWLAWSIWRDKGKGKSGGLAGTNTFLSGIVLQFVNVKALMYGMTTMSSFVLPYYRGFWPLLGFIGLMCMACAVGISCWAVFGTVFEGFFKSHGRLLNGIMALLLIYCAVSMVWEVFF